jgi:inhibitor of KinA sporulation pathway (predicted exonuclease)
METIQGNNRPYLVIDLEATCDDQHSIPREETEIIEIGAVLVDAVTLAPLGEWQSFVRPIRHPRLTPFCTQLTSITQADVASAPTFPVACAGLAKFVHGHDALFCSWGEYDRNQFRRDGARHGMRAPLGKDHLNLKVEFSRVNRIDAKLGVGQALARAGLRFQGTAHRGIDDARNIARLLPFVLGRVALPGHASRAPAHR